MYPTQREIMRPLLRVIAQRGGTVVFSNEGDEIENDLADHFELTDAQRQETRDDINIKGKRVWRLNIQWARKKCVEEGWLDGSVRDRWTLTEAGRIAAGPSTESRQSAAPTTEPTDEWSQMRLDFKELRERNSVLELALRQIMSICQGNVKDDKID
jgi:restriction endonuclease Mrr